jgi:hypothetical protein
MSLLVGITNARLSPTRRGVAVEVATRLAAITRAPVCLVGADPTDRDVPRHLPQLLTAWGTPKRMQVARGLHAIEVASFARSQVCVVSVSDRESVELVLPALQQRFEFLIVDAPSRAGFGVGIAGVLLGWLDALVVTTGVGAGELAEARRYTEQLDALPIARHVDVRVLAVGALDAGGLDREQLDARLAQLPMIGHVPRLGGHADSGPLGDAALDPVFVPVLRWIQTRAARAERTVADTDTDTDTRAEPADSIERHVANRLYREVVDP